MVIAYAAFFFFLVISIDYRITLQSKDKKEVIVYSVCLFTSIIVILLRSLDINLPDPCQYIIEGFKALSLI